MPLIAETGTGIDFPDGAVQNRNVLGKLIRVESRDGEVLWDAKTASSPKEEHTSQGHDLGYRADGSWWCRTCTKAKREEATKAAAEIASTAPVDNNSNAVALGNLGGSLGGQARAASLNPKQRHDIAKKAAESRWSRSRVGGVDRAMTDERVMSDTVSVTPEFPEPIIKAIVMVLGNAQYQTLRATDNQRMDDYFNGFLSGAHTVIGIIAGGLGYSTDFMLEGQGEGGHNHDAIHSGSAAVNHSEAH